MLFNISYTEWIGYSASAVLMISFLMKNLSTLRIINSAGAILFIFYGIMLKISWPIIITNGFILMVNIYYLYFKQRTKLISKKASFETSNSFGNKWFDNGPTGF